MLSSAMASETQIVDFLPEVEWQLRKDKHDIQVYTATIDGSSHRAVFAKIEMQASVESVVALLLDLPNCRKWATMCKEARIERRLSETESIVYGRNNLPFPVRDRDSYSVNKWSFDRITGLVAMDSRVAKQRQYPLIAGVIRLSRARVSWRIIPTKNKTVLVENYAHIEPNGIIPVWLTNALIVDAPYKALRKMRNLLQTGKYDQAKVAFLNTDTAFTPSKLINNTE